jgi:multicomponent Na+:H+ antiporter subunit E
MSRRRELAERALAGALWAYAVWLWLTWTVTAEQLLFGAGVAVVVGAILAPLGPVVGPWRLLNPRRVGAVLALLGMAIARSIRANVSLARRIWAPSRPLTSGMVIVPTSVESDAALTATALVTSAIVDNQFVDLERRAHRLQYHAVAVPDGTPEERAEAINAPIERWVRRIEGKR